MSDLQVCVSCKGRENGIAAGQNAYSCSRWAMVICVRNRAASNRGNRFRTFSPLTCTYASHCLGTVLTCSYWPTRPDRPMHDHSLLCMGSMFGRVCWSCTARTRAAGWIAHGCPRVPAARCGANCSRGHRHTGSSSGMDPRACRAPGTRDCHSPRCACVGGTRDSGYRCTALRSPGRMSWAASVVVRR